MSEDEAKQFGIPADERKRYMRLDKAKANIVRAVKARWFKLVSIPLGRGAAFLSESGFVFVSAEAQERQMSLTPSTMSS